MFDHDVLPGFPNDFTDRCHQHGLRQRRDQLAVHIRMDYPQG